MKFIKVDYYPHYQVREGSARAESLKLRSAFIRLDCFMQVDDPEEFKVHHVSWKDGNRHEEVETIFISHCYLSRMAGLGINGISTDLDLTEKSYNDVCRALEFPGAWPKYAKEIKEAFDNQK